jgi:hypothetical protein
MAVKPKPRSAASRVAHRLGGYASVALAPLLAIQCGVLWFLHNGGEITLPQASKGLLRDRLAESGLSCDWSEATVSLSGRIELTDARVGSAGGSGPVFEAGRLVTVLDVFDLIASGRITPRRLWLDRGRLICPAVLSPTGAPETALDEVRASLFREGDRLVVETLQARCAGIPLVAHGRILPPRTRAKSSGVPTANPMRAPGMAAARIVALRPWLARLDGASLELSGEDTPAGVKLDLTGKVASIRLPDAEVARVRLHFGALWADDGPHPSGRAVFTVDSFHVDRKAEGAIPAIVANCGRVSFRTSFGRDWELPTLAHLTAHRPEVNGYPLDRLDLRFDWSAKPVLNFDADALWHREHLGARVTLNGETGETRVEYDARVRLSELATHPAYPKKVPEELTALNLLGFTDMKGVVTLGKNYAFEKATLGLEAGHTRFGEIDVNSFRASADISRNWIRAYDLCLLSPEQRVGGEFETGLTKDARYRLALRGTAYPGQVGPFVGVWWHNIWKDLAVTPGHPVLADVYVDGHWSGVPYEFIFGSVTAEKLSYRKQVFDRAALRISEEPHRLVIYDMALANADGARAKGRLEWDQRMPDHELESVRFDFSGKLPLTTAAELGGADVVAALSDIVVRDPAEATVIGRYHGPASVTPGRDQLEVRVASKGPFSAWKLPGEDFSGTVLLDGNRIQIKDAKLRYAGGETKADAWILRLKEGYRLTFDTSFAKCDRAGFFDGLSKLKTAEPPKESAKEPVKASAKPAAPADLSGNFHARLALPDISTLDGQGHFETNDPELFKLPLLGALSRGMEKMGIDATTFVFESADSDFVIRGGSVYLPELTIRGPEAEVNAGGSYEIESGKLRFRAVLNPKSPDKIPLLDWARAIANRSTRLFPVNIRGTLDKPEWALDPSPSVIFKAKNDDRLGLPPAPPPDDGRW